MLEDFSPLVSTQWLAGNLGTEGLTVLDASLHLPGAKRDAKAEYEAAHIPGAQFLGLAGLTDKSSSVPAAIPSPAQLAQRLAELGWTEGAPIVLYDDSAIKSSARAWFILKAHGLRNLAVLDGGLGKWRSEGRALQGGVADHAPATTASLPSPEGVVTKSDVLAMLGSSDEQILDARAADRVFGTGIDPVHGGPNGRMPGAFNLPFNTLFKEDGTFKSPQDLRGAFEAAGIDLAKPIVTSCGSGVTASVLLFALHLIGVDSARLYDGSWQEWASDPDTPKLEGPEG